MSTPDEINRMFESIWELYLAECAWGKKNFHGSTYLQDAAAKATFLSKMSKKNDWIVVTYMKQNPPAQLDRHKIAAIIICTILTLDMVTHEVSEGQVSLLAQTIAVKTGLDFMLAQLNRELGRADLQPVDSIFMPPPFACETPYLGVITRSLYWAQEEDRLNVLDLAERLFLLEYVTLLEKKIDLEKLRKKLKES